MIIASSNKPVGGIPKLYTTFSFSGKMNLNDEQTSDSNVSKQISVSVSGYRLLWSNKFHGRITIDNMTIDDSIDE